MGAFPPGLKAAFLALTFAGVETPASLRAIALQSFDFLEGLGLMAALAFAERLWYELVRFRAELHFCYCNSLEGMEKLSCLWVYGVDGRW
jgi:hypothetical protein